jgi:hypothetical protein
MGDQSGYTINTHAKFNPLEFIDINKLSEECREDWFSQTLP